MTFVVTARKWRPQLFTEVVGQQHITTTLKNAIENNRIGHAYIFAGPRGVGKTTTARILAKRLNCKNPNGGEPCNECDTCKSFLKSQSLDIIEIDGASNRRIDEIRTLRESVKYAPTHGEYKVYIIDEVHMLTTESFNALLKTLEEPPERTIFIFATTDIHKVPLTIISRCQRFDFRRIELNEIKGLLKKIAEAEHIKIDDDSLTLIAKKADGALRDAESIFDQVVSFCGNEIDINMLRQMLNLIDEEIYFDISDAVLEKNFAAAFETSEKIYSNGWNYIDFINGLIEHFRNIVTVIVSDTTNFIEATESFKKKYEEYKNKFSEGDILRILSFLAKTQNELKISQNQKLKVEVTLTQLIGFEKSSTISELLDKVSKSNLGTDKKKSEFEKPTVKQEPNEVTPNKKLIDYRPEPVKKNKPVEKKTNSFNTDIIDSPQIKNEKSGNIDIESIKSNWTDFRVTITNERFTLGPLLEHSLPSSIIGDSITIDVNNKDDVKILNGSIDFLTKRFQSYFKTSLKLKFVFNGNINLGNVNNDDNTQDKDDKTYQDHPLIKSIISDLGGKEIK